MSIRARALVLAVALGASRAGTAPADEALPIGIIDFYGLGGVPAERARAALTFKEGETVSFAGDEPPAFIAASEANLAALPGVQRAKVNLVCCDAGRVIVYVGIQERGTEAMSFRPAPTGDARLADDIVLAGEEFSQALTAAGQRGDMGEDRTQGHALNHDPAMRAIQDRFLLYASRDLPALRRVLRTSSSAGQRSLAAHVLGYAADKSAVVDDLVYGMRDPAGEVRNSAMRALMVIGEMTPSPERKVPPVPAAPFIALLNSSVWTDRNKASLTLEALTRHRDPGLLDALRRDAITPLVEIARWKSDGHAQPGFFVLARIANYTDDAALDLWQRGEPEAVIRAAIARAL